MLKKLLYLLSLYLFLGFVNVLSSELIPIKKPSQSKEIEEKNLLSDILLPLPKPSSLIESSNLNKKIVVKKVKKITQIFPKKKPLIAGTKKNSDIKISKFYNKKDFKIAKKAFSEMKQSKWTVALKTSKKARDKSIYNFIQWRHLLTRGNKATFYDYKAFIDANENYPRIGRIKYLAEHKLSTNAISPKKIINWFGPQEPLSGFGKMILGESLILVGEVEKGIDYIKTGWITAELSTLPLFLLHFNLS